MKKVLILTIGAVIIVAAIYFAPHRGSNATEQAVQQQTNSEVDVAVASSNTSLNLHFENLRLNPTLEQ